MCLEPLNDAIISEHCEASKVPERLQYIYRQVDIEVIMPLPKCLTLGNMIKINELKCMICFSRDFSSVMSTQHACAHLHFEVFAATLSWNGVFSSRNPFYRNVS